MFNAKKILLFSSLHRYSRVAHICMHCKTSAHLTVRAEMKIARMVLAVNFTVFELYTSQCIGSLCNDPSSYLIKLGGKKTVHIATAIVTEIKIEKVRQSKSINRLDRQ